MIDQDPAGFAEPWQPPSNDEAEQALLGCILAKNTVYDLVSDIVTAQHFADGVHARIFGACASLINGGQAADAITLKAYFDREDALADVGGARYLADLQANYVTLINAKDYARTIRDLALRREMLAIAQRMTEQASYAPPDVEVRELAEEAAESIGRVLESGHVGEGLVDMATLGPRVAQEVEDIQRGDVVPGLSTGLRDLDEALAGGFHRGHLIVLAARPSMGKSALAGNIAWSVASRKRQEADSEQAQPVAFFSLEMTAEDLTRRLAAERAGVAFYRTNIAQGLTAVQHDAFTRECLALRSLPLRIDDSAALTVTGIRSRALAMKRRQGLSLVIVDYLQLMAAVSGERGNQNSQVAAITKGLKEMAKALDVPVLVLSQLSRAVELRDDKRPMLSDLRDSGAIEQDADEVIFLYREHYYLERQGEPVRKEGKEEDKAYYERLNGYHARLEATKGLGDIMLSKARNGRVSTVKAAFDGWLMWWSDSVPVEEDPGELPMSGGAAW